MKVQNVDENKRITINVRMSILNREIELTLKRSTTGRRIIDKLLSAKELGLPELDDIGNPYNYLISVRETGDKTMSLDQTLDEVDVREGYTLIINPELIAGGGYDSPALHLEPTKFYVESFNKDSKTIVDHITPIQFLRRMFLIAYASIKYPFYSGNVTINYETGQISKE